MSEDTHFLLKDRENYTTIKEYDNNQKNIRIKINKSLKISNMFLYNITKDEEGMSLMELYNKLNKTNKKMDWIDNIKKTKLANQKYLIKGWFFIEKLNLPEFNENKLIESVSYDISLNEIFKSENSKETVNIKIKNKFYPLELNADSVGFFKDVIEQINLLNNEKDITLINENIEKIREIIEQIEKNYKNDLIKSNIESVFTNLSSSIIPFGSIINSIYFVKKQKKLKK